ncbi:MAG: T9SS type A sorting domain-containing protein [Bacteroidia bacterium]
MKTKLALSIILLSVFFIYEEGMAQTNVSGFISANTTWNLAGSPYILVGNTLVSHGYILTVEPGVIVKFNTDKALQIDGELIAIGTSANRITFTSNQPSPAAGDWAKIHFPDTCVDAVFDTVGNYLSGSIMKYCDVLYGGGLGFGEIQVEGSSPYFTHCNISNSSADGIHCNGSTCLVDSSSLKFCAGYGLSFDYYFLQSNSLLVQDDSILNNSSGGIYSGNNGLGAVLYPYEIKRNVFISNSQDGALFIDYDVWEATVSENYFFNNTSQGSSGIVTIAGRNLTVTCNRFINNQVANHGTLYLENSNDFGISYIDNNVFDGNISNAAVSALFLVCNNYPSPQQTIYLTNNVIENNVSASGGSTCYFRGYPIPNNEGLFNLAHNNIVNNQAATTLQLNTGASQNNNTNRYAVLKNNNLINPAVQYEIENNLPYGDANIYADSNYWGGTITQHIDSVIYDYFDFANQTVVYYNPILTSPIILDSSCSLIPMGIMDFNKPTYPAISLYPNPATDYLTIKTGSNKKQVITITDITSKIIYTATTPSDKTIINTKDFSQGVYAVQVQADDFIETKKVIVVR